MTITNRNYLLLKVKKKYFAFYLDIWVTKG